MMCLAVESASFRVREKALYITFDFGLGNQFGLSFHAVYLLRSSLY
jgi:hypothetical protein